MIPPNSRYRLLAKRVDEAEWSVWTEIDDVTRIEFHLQNIRSLGYEAKVIDPKITEWESKHKHGYLLFNPVRVGQSVYKLLTDDEYIIESWTVRALHFDGSKWYAVGDTGEPIEVGTIECIPTLMAAQKLRKRLKASDR